MALGRASQQLELLDPVTRFCEETLPGNSIFAFLHEHRDTLFPDGMFTDLFAVNGRRSVPPSVVAVVMVLQRLEGLSDREAVDRFMFDARWRYAAGVGGWDGAGRAGFAHTVLVDMRERLRRSDRPDRVFEVALAAARNAGLIGRRRVLDSTPLYDAVATMDTITLIRTAIRGLLTAAGAEPAAGLRAVLAGSGSGDDYTSTAKPVIDWDDTPAREALIDSRAQDGHALLTFLDGREDLPQPVEQAMRLLATVLGQDLETGPDGTLRIARKVAADRVISTVDPEARHGHKTNHRGFDGYKGHIAVDPDSEIVTATAVTAGNTGDVEPVADLITDLTDPDEGPTDGPDGGTAAVYGDAAYGAGEILDRLDRAGIDAKTKVQPPVAPTGKFTKDRFTIDLGEQRVTCPNGTVRPIRRVKDHPRHAGKADFGAACAACPLRGQCTDAKAGRSITIGHHEARLTAARTRQQDPAWKADYRATRPKVERKIAHLMRRRHGGRRARMRGRVRIAADFNLLAAAVNLARLATLGLSNTRHLDEIMSAAGHQESDYLVRVTEFQLRELDLGRPVATIVTGRTGVHHRLLMPADAEVLEMQPFAPEQVSAWLAVWNTTNRRYFAEHSLEPLSRDVALRQPELAVQPLLLLMLALYDAQANELTRADERIGGAELYERLMILFAEREARRERPRLAGAPLAEHVEHNLGRLSVAALAMLNRRRQSVSEADLDADLAALGVGSEIGDEGPTPAQKTIGGFFFVAENRARTGPAELRSFEFLHSTFGEYLAARLIASELHALTTEAGHTDDRLHALLSFGLVLAEHQEVLAFVRGRLTADHYDTIVAALRTALDLRPRDGHPKYRPMALDVPTRTATYSVNLILLLMLARDTVGVRALFPRVADPLATWARHSSLWRSCLNFDAVVSALRGRRVRETRDVVIAREDGTPVSVNESIGLHVYPDTEFFDHQCNPAPDLKVRAGSQAGRRLRAASLLLDPERDGLLDAIVPLIRVRGDLSIDRGWDTDLTNTRVELEQLLAREPPAPPARLVTPSPPPHA